MNGPAREEAGARGWGPLSPFGEALRFLTVLPAPGLGAPTAVGAHAGLPAFPAVGWLLGGLGALLWLALEPSLGPALGAWAVLALWAFATRGLHLDGVADLGDALGSSRDRTRMLEILKDSRIGTMGALALIFLLGAQALAISGLAQNAGPRAAALAILVAPALGRALSLGAMAAFAVLGVSSLAGPMRAHARHPRVQLVGWLVLLVPLLWLLGPLHSAAVVALGLAFAALAAWRVQRALGGLNGDGYGAITELGQLAAPLALLLTT